MLVAQVSGGVCRAGDGREGIKRRGEVGQQTKGRSEKSVLGMGREIERGKKEIEGGEGRRGEMKGKRGRIKKAVTE